MSFKRIVGTLILIGATVIATMFYLNRGMIFYEEPLIIDSYLDDLNKVVTATNYDCPSEIDETHFAPDDLITLALDIVYVQDDINIVDTLFDPRSSIDTINKVLWDGNMEVKLRNQDTLTLDYIGGGMYYRGLLTYIKQNYAKDALIWVVVPENVLFNEELKDDGTIKKLIKGAALSLNSNIFFVRENFANTHVVTHELAHCLGIRHIFAQPDYSEDGYSSLTGDYICDTPKADGEMGVSKTCQTVILGDVKNTEEEIDILVFNIMSYSPHECLRDFTLEQLITMRNMISGTKTHLVYSEQRLLELSAKQLIYGEI